MKVTLYQIANELDTKMLMFRNLEFFQKIVGDRFPSEIYEVVFDGELDTTNPEEVYRIFNTEYTPGYKGRSMSVSDVVEFQIGSTSIFYFCDSIGFQKIEFDKGAIKKGAIKRTNMKKWRVNIRRYGNAGVEADSFDEAWEKAKNLKEEDFEWESIDEELIEHEATIFSEE